MGDIEKNKARIASAGLALLLLLASVPVKASPMLGPVLSNGEQHYYEFFANPVDWLTAKSNAEALSYLGVSGHLVTIREAAENAFVNTLRAIAPNPDGQYAVWIGLTDAAVEGTFVWITGEPLGYTNWFPGEPNNSGNEDYGVMGAGALWNDLSLSYIENYVVEYDTPSGVPLPAALPLFASGLGAIGLLGWRRKRKNAKRVPA